LPSRIVHQWITAFLPNYRKAFASPQEVTSACLECHNGTHKEIMASSHWNWERVSYIEGRGITSLGKKNILNNFCTGAGGNEQRCAVCHIGFGMSGDKFDFNNKKTWTAWCAMTRVRPI
jgi:hypothetical protein